MVSIMVSESSNKILTAQQKQSDCKAVKVKIPVRVCNWNSKRAQCKLEILILLTI